MVVLRKHDVVHIEEINNLKDEYLPGFQFCKYWTICAANGGILWSLMPECFTCTMKYMDTEICFLKTYVV